MSQFVSKYGETDADKLLSLFQIRIYGRLQPGDTQERVQKRLGKRYVSALVQNREPAANDKRTRVEERRWIPTFSGKQLASETESSYRRPGQVQGSHDRPRLGERLFPDLAADALAGETQGLSASPVADQNPEALV